LRPHGQLVTQGGGPLRGPFVASPSVTAWPPLGGRRALSIFETPLRALAFGWYRSGMLAPFARLFIAGGTRGQDARLQLWCNQGPRTLLLECPGRRQRLRVGARSSTISIPAAAGRTSTCTLRLIAGSI